LVRERALQLGKSGLKSEKEKGGWGKKKSLTLLLQSDSYGERRIELNREASSEVTMIANGHLKINRKGIMGWEGPQPLQVGKREGPHHKGEGKKKKPQKGRLTEVTFFVQKS